MSYFRNILAVLQIDAQAPRLLEKVAAIAAQSSDVSLVRVVYEGLADLKSKHIDASVALKELVLESEQESLTEVIEATHTDIDNLTCAVMWNARLWEGIAHAAESCGAELIVKPSDGDATLGALRTPDDWNLLRHSEVPVLLTQPRRWHTPPTIVVALDIYDLDHEALNDRILAVARDFAAQCNGELHLASVFPALSVWLDEVTTVQSYHKLRKDIEEEIFDGLATLAAEQNIADATSHAMEGLAPDAMKRLINSLDADVLVIGTKARKGIAGALLGNTAEKLLHEVGCDILTVP